MDLLPQPQKVTEREGRFYTDYRTVIMIHRDCGASALLSARMLQETIGTWAGMDVEIRKGEPEKGDILLQVDSALAEGHYILSIEEDYISVTGSCEEALMQGVQTLRQIYAVSGAVIKSMVIEDFPVIKNRGFYHDVTRGRVPRLSELKKLVDTMCYYKLNQLQLYVEHTYLFRNFSEVWRDETPLEAWEILELDQYCRERHVDLIPSLSTFGHLYKLLRTYSYGEYCERREAPYQPFSFDHRMHRHTVDVSNPDTLPLIKGMIREYMDLFSSQYFNICADETFDLCLEKSSHLKQEQEVKKIYTDYVRELSEFLLENGKIPMFWGDILCGFPEKIKDLPAENICLNWGYMPTQREDDTAALKKAGATQYTCPGVGGWNQWVNLFENAYQNISRMCTYAVKYEAVGVLNTDWGDFGHINQPAFSVPGLIYGAAFSWNADILDFEEINRRISRLEYHDADGGMMAVLADIAGKEVFSWHDAVWYREMELWGEDEDKRRQCFFRIPAEPAAAYNRELAQIRRALQEISCNLDSSTRRIIQKYLLGIDAVIIWNKVKPALAEKLYGQGEKADCSAVAAQLEEWFMKYKTEWRKVSKEGDIVHISNIIFWYCDLLRK